MPKNSKHKPVKQKNEATQKQKTNKGKRYEKPISLYPIPFEQAVTALLSVPRPKKQQKKGQIK